jgi:hypothetical protein
LFAVFPPPGLPSVLAVLPAVVVVFALPAVVVVVFALPVVLVVVFALPVVLVVVFAPPPVVVVVCDAELLPPAGFDGAEGFAAGAAFGAGFGLSAAQVVPQIPNMPASTTAAEIFRMDTLFNVISDLLKWVQFC